MANSKISDLPVVTGSGVDEDDKLVIVNGAATKAIAYKELLSNAALAEAPNGAVPSAKITFASGAIVEASMATNSVNTAAVKDDNITAAKLANSSTSQLATSAPTADFTGQTWVDTDDGHKVYVWDGSAWQQTKAGGSVNTIAGATGNLVNITSTAGGTPSGSQYTIDATIDNFSANTFLAGPTSGSAATPTSRAIDGADLPVAASGTTGGVKVNGEGLRMDSGVIEVDADVTAQTTFAVVKCSAKGLITETQTLANSAAELPVATTSAKGAVIVTSGGGLTVDGSGNLSITNSVTGATKCKVTYDSDGLITAGGDLAADDIPAISADKITSGALDAARLPADGVDGTKLSNSSTCIIQSIAQAGFPTALFTGQLCFDSVAEDAYLWDGNAWQAITTLTKGSLIFGGNFNCSTSKMASVTTAGTAAGLVVGSNLPTASASVDGVYVVVSTAGTPSSPAPAVSLSPPDYILGVTNASGSSWQEIDLSATVSGQVATNVGFTPYGDISSSNVQDALQEVSTEKLPKSGGEITGELLIGAAGSLVFEGATANAYEITLAPSDPTSADRTVTIPDQTGNLIVSGNASLVNADVATNAAIDYSKLAALADGKILMGNGSNVPTAVTPSGDVTITNAGVAAIASGVIVNADINASAAIAGSKLAAGSTSAQGALQLSDATNSTSTSLAATANAVKVTKDVADAALPKAGGTLTGNINLDNDKQLNLYEADSNGSAYIGLKAPTDMGSTSSYTLSLPATAPAANKILKCDGSTPTTLVWGDDSATDSTKMPTAGGTFTGAVTWGADDTGYDVKMFGATAGAYLLWDESDDALKTAGEAVIDVVKDKFKIGGVAMTCTSAELNILDGVTSTTAELNILDGVTSTTAELNILDGVTANATEINLLDGKSAIGDALLGTAQTFTATQSGTITSIAYGSSVSLNLNTTNNFVIAQLTGAFTLANPSALTAGASGAIKITQHSSSPVVAGWGTYWHFPTGSANAALSTTAGAIDVLVYTVLSATSVACQLIKDVKD